MIPSHFFDDRRIFGETLGGTTNLPRGAAFAARPYFTLRAGRAARLRGGRLGEGVAGGARRIMGYKKPLGTGRMAVGGAVDVGVGRAVKVGGQLINGLGRLRGWPRPGRLGFPGASPAELGALVAPAQDIHGGASAAESGARREEPHRPIKPVHEEAVPCTMLLHI